MATLTVTARGQLTLRKEFLEHIGVMPGDKIDIEKTLDGKLTLERAEAKGRWEDLAGFLKGKTNGARLTIKQINEAIGAAAAAEVMESFNR